MYARKEKANKIPYQAKFGFQSEREGLNEKYSLYPGYLEIKDEMDIEFTFDDERILLFQITKGKNHSAW